MRLWKSFKNNNVSFTPVAYTSFNSRRWGEVRQFNL